MSFNDMEQLIRDYRWMKNEVARLQTLIYGYHPPMSSWGVAQYGIDAAMPKGSSIRSAAEMEAMDLRDKRQWDRLKKYEAYIYAVEKAPDFLAGEKNKIVFDCMLEGMSYRKIGTHLEMSRDKVRDVKDDIISQLCQNDHFRQLLNCEICA